MKILTIIIRSLLGLVFVVFGANGFLRFLPMPPLPHGLVGEFLHAFFASGYVYAIAACQFVGGLLLLIGRFVPLGLTILGPIIVNIVLFHILLATKVSRSRSSSRPSSFSSSGDIGPPFPPSCGRNLRKTSS